MRYFCYNVLTENAKEHTVVTVSEEEIRKTYYPWWYDRMCEKYGREEVEEKGWSFYECLEDWIISHKSWEADDEE